MSYYVVLLERARQEMQEIYDWIAERSPDGAPRWFNRFNEALETLEQSPTSCSLAPENDYVHPEIRQLLFKTRKGRTYRALFTIVGDEVRVLHVRGPGQRLLDADEL